MDHIHMVVHGNITEPILFYYKQIFPRLLRGYVKINSQNQVAYMHAFSTSAHCHNRPQVDKAGIWHRNGWHKLFELT